MERLQKLIAQSGYCSRRNAEDLIRQGKVKLNGTIVTELGTKASVNDAIEVEGNMLKLEEDKVYFLLNKPRGVISSAKDEAGRKTVVDLIETDKRIYPVGRLDYDTTGIMILTNDGDLTNTLTHPNFKVEKKYVAKLNKYFEISDLKKLQSGVDIDGVMCIPTRVKIKVNNREKDFSIVEVSIVEGRNHIIKKVFMKLGYLVDKLTRIELGFLNLNGLQSGEYRQLSLKEVKKLYEFKK